MIKKILSAYCCLLALTSNSQTLTTSLTACYDLNGNGIETVNSLTGTLSAATPTLDRFNNVSSALQFNGTIGSFVELPEDPLIKPSPAVSFALWVKPESLSGPGSGGKHIVFTKNNQSSNFEAYQFEIFNGTFWRLNKANATLNNIVLSTSTVVLGQWCHIACTIDNTSLKLYVNGVLEGQTPSTFNGFDYMTGKKVYLAGTNESFNHPFTGALDNLKFWNRVITQTEVTQLFQTDPACTPGPSPVAGFNLSATSICVGGAISFTNTSSNSPTSFNWQVSGPSSLSSTVSAPAFTFNTAGNYSVNLTVSNSSGSNTATQTFTVHANPSLTITPSSNSVCLGSTVNLQASGAANYTWSTAQNSASIQVTPSLNTVYSVQGSNTFGCASSSSVAIMVVVCSDVSVKEWGAEAELAIYPNPVSGVLNLRTTKQQTVSLIDVQGRVLLHQAISPNQVETIDLSAYPQGLYFLKSELATKPIKILKD